MHEINIKLKQLKVSLDSSSWMKYLVEYEAALKIVRSFLFKILIPLIKSCGNFYNLHNFESIGFIYYLLQNDLLKNILKYSIFYKA